MKKYALLGTLLVLSRLCAADFNTGVEAYNKGDYTKALKEWLVVAQQKETPAVTANFEWHSAFVKNTVDAQYALGLLYWQGKGVAQDYKIAEKWLRLAASSAHSDAQLKLAYLYSSDLVGKPDYAKAKTWLEKSAAQNNANAEYNLGVMYYQGLGVKPDTKIAKNWLTRSLQHGEKSAADLLAKINAEPTVATIEPKPIETAPPPPAPLPTPTHSTAAVAVPQQIDTTAPTITITEPAKTPPNQPEPAKVPLTQSTAVDKSDMPAKTNAGLYTVQLFSSRNKSDVERLQTQWQDTIKPLVIGEKSKNGQALFRLLYGEFSSNTQAQQAINKLPSELKKHQPWVFKKQANEQN